MAADTRRLRRVFADKFGREPIVIAEAPGRVNLIGEHTDYNDGFVLPIAIDRTVVVAAAPREDRLLRAYSLDYDEMDEAEYCASRLPNGGWKNYVRGVAGEIARLHVSIAGVDLAIAGDVPVGAGLSSSAAVEVAVAGAIAAANGVEIEKREIALLAQRAENDFVGVQCGVMDQFAAALSTAGSALLIDCRSYKATPVPMADGVAVVVVSSGVARDLADTEYNRRRQECAEAADFLDVDSLRDVAEERLIDIESELEPTLFRRVRHVVTEDGRVLAAADALRRGDTTGLGHLLHRSHESLRDDFEVSTPELDRLVDIALGVDGVFGARLTGAGFGGCVVALVRPDVVGELAERIVSDYRTASGKAAEVWVCKASDGLRVIRA
jgi:galactokinase